jgi:spermidine synthase
LHRLNIRQLPYALTIGCSSALLFVVQPIMAKAILPRFGGTAGVWVACMLFFQVALLLGYLYSFWITRYLGARARTGVHVALVVASLAVLPLGPQPMGATGHPTLDILLLLALSAGLPFFVLSTTGPLVQTWYAGTGTARFPYRLFALSNAASLVALLAYPVIVEPALTVSEQLRWWSGGYLVVAVLLVLGAIANRRWSGGEPDATDARDAASRPLLWIALAAGPSTLWLATANYLSQEVAAIPFLWVVPLGIYLLTFILCFEWEGWYRPALFRWLLPVAWIAMGSRIGLAGAGGDLRLDFPILLAGLFICCMFCHGELARLKPAPRRGLAYFYLMVAAGGALGGVFVGVAAPNLFPTFLELPIGIVGTVFLALMLLYGITSAKRLIRLAVVSVGAFAVASTYSGGKNSVLRERNFYGALQIADSGEGERAVRTLYNGRTVHGLEFLSPARRRMPTTYYGERSGAGIVLEASPAPNRRVAFIGLGAGTLATYGRSGDSFRFYEINPAVIRAASEYFHFLGDSKASTDVVEDDGRLGLEREPPASFDAIVLDAFSDDAIPVHLLTQEAFALYFARLRAGCPLAIHLTNRYLDLNPVVEALAAAAHKRVVRIHSAGDAERQTLSADWAVVTDSNAYGEAERPQRVRRVWTDGYSNLFQAWK